MSDTNTNKNTAPETKVAPDSAEAKKVAARAGQISEIILAQLRQNFPVPAAAEARLNRSEAEELAFRMARREADLERTKQVRASLLHTAPENSDVLRTAKDEYHLARQRYEAQAETIARRTGIDQSIFFDTLDTISDTVKQGAAVVRRNAVPITAVAGTAAYVTGTAIGGQGLAALGTKIAAAVGGASTLSWFVNGGIVTAAAAAGYGVGKFAGRGIDALTKRWLGYGIGAEKIGKYVGMVGGGIGSAAGLGLTATSFGLSVGIPAAVWGSWKLGKSLYHYVRRPRKFDLQAATTAMERNREGAAIVRAIDRIRKTYMDVGGSATNSLVVRLDTLRGLADGLARVPNAEQSLAEVQAEWDKLRPEAEEAIKKAQARTAERAPDVRAAQVFGAQITALRTRWAALAPIGGGGAPAIPADLEASLAGVTTMVTDFTGPNARHTLKAIEDAYKAAEDQFNKAWDKQTERRDSIRKINMYTGQCAELRNRWATALPVPAPRPALPGDVDGALTGIAAMVTNFASATPTYTAKQVEDAFDEAKGKFNKAWDRAVERSDNVRKAGVYTVRLTEMRTRWAALTPPVPMPGVVDAAINEANVTIADFTGATPRFTMADVEEDFKHANTLFRAAWEKALDRTDQEIPELRALGGRITADSDGVYASFNPANANHPAAHQAYAAATAAHTALRLANTRLQAARTVEEAKKFFGIIQAQQEVLSVKIPEARAILQRSDTVARQAIAAVRNMLPADVAVVRDLPRRFQDLKRYTDGHQREVDAAKLRNATSTELETIWNTNRPDIARARDGVSTQLDTLLASGSWPRPDIDALRTDFNAAIDGGANPQYRPVNLKAVLEGADARLTRSTQDASSQVVGDLTALRSVAGDGVNAIDRLIQQYSNVATLPVPADAERVLSLYLAA